MPDSVERARTFLPNIEFRPVISTDNLAGDLKHNEEVLDRLQRPLARLFDAVDAVESQVVSDRSDPHLRARLHRLTRASNKQVLRVKQAEYAIRLGRALIRQSLKRPPRAPVNEMGGATEFAVEKNNKQQAATQGIDNGSSDHLARHSGEDVITITDNDNVPKVEHSTAEVIIIDEHENDPPDEQAAGIPSPPPPAGGKFKENATSDATADAATLPHDRESKGKKRKAEGIDDSESEFAGREKGEKENGMKDGKKAKR